MKKSITLTFCGMLFVMMTAATGCESNTGVVQSPEPTAEELAADEARKAEYNKAMEEAYGK